MLQERLELKRLARAVDVEHLVLRILREALEPQLPGVLVARVNLVDVGVVEDQRAQNRTLRDLVFLKLERFFVDASIRILLLERERR